MRTVWLASAAADEVVAEAVDDATAAEDVDAAADVDAAVERATDATDEIVRTGEDEAVGRPEEPVRVAEINEEL